MPFNAGRGDATQEMTDENSFNNLEPLADGYRNWIKAEHSNNAEEMMINKTQLLGLTAPEMTVLLGGMRSLGISNDDHGIFTGDSDKLTNDYFAMLLDMSVQWKPNGSSKSFEGIDRVSGEKIRTASRVDLAFGSNSQLRAIAEVYASSDAQDKFSQDFVSAWNKVMNIDLI